MDTFSGIEEKPVVIGMKVYLDTAIIVTGVQELRYKLLFIHSLLVDFTYVPFYEEN